MPAFPIKWRVIDEEHGWIICDVINQMADPGDGSVHGASNITVLHYAGDNHFSHEEDAYNPMAFMVMVKAWCRARQGARHLAPQRRGSGLRRWADSPSGPGRLALAEKRVRGHADGLKVLAQDLVEVVGHLRR